MKKFDGNIVVFDLRETYHELCEYSFKIVLNPKLFKNCHDVDVKILDANNDLMEVDVRRWGRKVNCTFVLNETIPDGVCVVRLRAAADSGKNVVEKFSFWVIK